MTEKLSYPLWGDATPHTVNEPPDPETQAKLDELTYRWRMRAACAHQTACRSMATLMAWACIEHRAVIEAVRMAKLVAGLYGEPPPRATRVRRCHRELALGWGLRIGLVQLEGGQ